MLQLLLFCKTVEGSNICGSNDIIKNGSPLLLQFFTLPNKSAHTKGMDFLDISF